MIGNLLYLTSRPYIMQSMGLVSRFQESSKVKHVQAIKRIFRYLKGTLDFVLWYPQNEDLTMVSYVDAD